MTLSFYLGTHQPAWLWSEAMPRDVALFVSHRRLDGSSKGPRVSRYPAARVQWALDSGGFSELSLFGEWRTTPEEYVAAVIRYDTEIGHLEWAAPQDWMCEPVMIARTGLSVAEHQARTVANFIRLQELWDLMAPAGTESPFMPVLQGWELADYLRCWDLYDAAGINLADYPVVGVGSVCRRQATGEIGGIVAALRAVDAEIPLHGFGVKALGLARYGHHLGSSDSMAWSLDARRSDPLNGCAHPNCANCMTYALGWRTRTLAAAGGAR